MKLKTTPSILLLLLVLFACSESQNEMETGPTTTTVETLTERARSGEEIVTFVVVNDVGEVYACLSAEILASVQPQCGAPPGDTENPRLLGPKVAGLKAALPIGGDVALKLSETRAGWTLDDWGIIRDFCDDAAIVEVLKAADLCS